MGPIYCMIFSALRSAVFFFSFCVGCSSVTVPAVHANNWSNSNLAVFGAPALKPFGNKSLELVSCLIS